MVVQTVYLRSTYVKNLKGVGVDLSLLQKVQKQGMILAHQENTKDYNFNLYFWFTIL